jgi:hypothetical protein
MRAPGMAMKCANRRAVRWSAGPVGHPARPEQIDTARDGRVVRLRTRGESLREAVVGGVRWDLVLPGAWVVVRDFQWPAARRDGPAREAKLKPLLFGLEKAMR